jgi:hypothetical protein
VLVLTAAPESALAASAVDAGALHLLPRTGDITP